LEVAEKRFVLYGARAGAQDDVTTRNEKAAQTDTRKVEKLARTSAEDLPSMFYIIN
jgi:aspartate/tyrosine/aromatic aminotransferase